MSTAPVWVLSLEEKKNPRQLCLGGFCHVSVMWEEVGDMLHIGSRIRIKNVGWINTFLLQKHTHLIGTTSSTKGIFFQSLLVLVLPSAYDFSTTLQPQRPREVDICWNICFRCFSLFSVFFFFFKWDNVLFNCCFVLCCRVTLFAMFLKSQGISSAPLLVQFGKHPKFWS